MGDEKGSQRIPRESLHDQDDRLTSKHIQTLGFLQELAHENKALKIRVDELEKDLSECQDLHDFAKESKEKIKDIQDSYLARADEINLMLSEKHRIEVLQIQEEKLEVEREMKENMLRMRHELEALQAANKDLRDTAAEEDENNDMKRKLKQTDTNLQQALAENEELRQEIECLQGDLEVLQGKKSTDMIHLRELRSENKRLEETLQEVQQKKNELEFRLDKALTELKENNDNEPTANIEHVDETCDPKRANSEALKLYGASQHPDKDSAVITEKLNLIENLRDKVKQLSFERDQGVEIEAKLKKENTALQANANALKTMNFQLQEELEKLLSEYGHLAIEHEQLRKKCMKDKDKKTFKDFVSLKRELNHVKDENDGLKTRLKSGSLSVLKDDPPPPAILPPVPKSLKKYAQVSKKKMLAISLSNSTNDK